MSQTIISHHFCFDNLLLKPLIRHILDNDFFAKKIQFLASFFHFFVFFHFHFLALIFTFLTVFCVQTIPYLVE
jgi:hypothetical protein